MSEGGRREALASRANSGWRLVGRARHWRTGLLLLPSAVMRPEPGQTTGMLQIWQGAGRRWHEASATRPVGRAMDENRTLAGSGHGVRWFGAGWRGAASTASIRRARVLCAAARVRRKADKRANAWGWAAGATLGCGVGSDGWLVQAPRPGRCRQMETLAGVLRPGYRLSEERPHSSAC